MRTILANRFLRLSVPMLLVAVAATNAQASILADKSGISLYVEAGLDLTGATPEGNLVWARDDVSQSGTTLGLSADALIQNIVGTAQVSTAEKGAVTWNNDTRLTYTNEYNWESTGLPGSHTGGFFHSGIGGTLPVAERVGQGFYYSFFSDYGGSLTLDYDVIVESTGGTLLGSHRKYHVFFDGLLVDKLGDVASNNPSTGQLTISFSPTSTFAHEIRILNTANLFNNIDNLERYGKGVFDISLSENNPVPEPATIAVWSLIGLCGVGYGVRRRMKQAA